MRASRKLAATVWAPLAVLAASFPLGATPFAESGYSLLHVLGGAALAYVFLAFGSESARDAFLTSLVAFSLACTTALFWEIGEFALDELAGTSLQEGRVDTMTDLILAAAGAAAYLVLRRCPLPRPNATSRGSAGLCKRPR